MCRNNMCTSFSLLILVINLKHNERATDLHMTAVLTKILFLLNILCMHTHVHVCVYNTWFFFLFFFFCLGPVCVIYSHAHTHTHTHTHFPCECVFVCVCLLTSILTSKQYKASKTPFHIIWVYFSLIWVNRRTWLSQLTVKSALPSLIWENVCNHIYVFCIMRSLC